MRFRIVDSPHNRAGRRARSAGFLSFFFFVEDLTVISRKRKKQFRDANTDRVVSSRKVFNVRHRAIPRVIEELRVTDTKKETEIRCCNENARHATITSCALMKVSVGRVLGM